MSMWRRSGPIRAKESLKNHYDLALLSKKLATIDRHSPFELKLEDARIGNLYNGRGSGTVQKTGV